MTPQTNAEVTAEQVCWGLRVVCRLWLQVRRGLGAIAAASAPILYHQRRNAEARESHKIRFVLAKFWIVSRSRMSFSPPALASQRCSAGPGHFPIPILNNVPFHLSKDTCPLGKTMDWMQKYGD
jgi:hypothetical protein